MPSYEIKCVGCDWKSSIYINEPSGERRDEKLIEEGANAWGMHIMEVFSNLVEGKKPHSLYPSVREVKEPPSPLLPDSESLVAGKPCGWKFSE